MNIPKFVWYINRLSKMSPPEVLYRVKQVLRQQWDKRIYRLNFRPKENKELNLKPIFKLSHEISNKNNTELKKIVSQAEDVLNNRFKIFGIKVDYGDKIDWHLDPKTKKRWPLKFWADIDIRDGFTIGGVKFVWEINRFYFMPVLGITFQITNDQRFADKIFLLLSDWLEANPYPIGVNWTSGIELALRISNLVWALSFLKNYPINKEQKVLINRFIYIHAHHLIRYPSKYSSNNNHAIAEAFGLFLAGLYFKHLKESKKWFLFGKKVLERELARQILPDGGSLECTTTYLSFVADFLLLFIYICNKEKIPYSSVLNDRLLHVCNFIRAIMDKNGNIPNIGDQDSAILVNFGLDNYENFKSILNSGAVFFKRGDFCCDNYPDLKTELLFGEKVRKVRRMYIKPSSTFFRHSGLAVIREEFKGKEIVFVANCMPLGMPPLYAHGHLDALSFTLSVDGYEFFIDPGTYLYHSGGKWRMYFRSTAAHNTVRINEKDIVRQVADFMFANTYKVECFLWENNSNEIHWGAYHNGYTKKSPYVKHTRFVKYFKNQGKFIISDILESKNEYIAEWFFHLHPECTLELTGNKVVISRKSINILLQTDTLVPIKVIRGQLEPVLGWYSKNFNHIQETNTITWKLKCKGKLEFNTTLIIGF